ncbi:AAA family ATPase [Flavobacterium davisii]|uniref:AAA family ATPase n=1 Tax=Flavobacterium davisii TaxID=2906077 RepID=UPI000B4CC221|nr:AAA family ATPase [Flavobacterium davisii]
MLANPQTTVTKKTKKKEGNAVKNADALLKKKFVEIKIEDQNLKAHLGEPQLGNSHWFIFGDSGQGKTSYTLALVKELTKNYKVLYNTLEEGDKKSFQNAIRRTGLKGNKNFLYLQANYEQIIEQLLKEKQPKIVVIDSAQYLFRGKQVQHYANLVNKFKNTTFIWISGADGTKPKGKIADDIRYDCDIVIFVKDFKAEIKKNRFEANASYIVWEEGYKQTLLK